ncbi:MAG: hypothetical protein AAGD92_07040 [Pseudomonadota bacterium]
MVQQDVIRKMTDMSRRKTPEFKVFNDHLTNIIERIKYACAIFFEQSVDILPCLEKPVLQSFQSLSSHMDSAMIWRFVNEVDEETFITIDRKSVTVVARWALERILCESDDDTVEEQELSILDRQLAYLLVRQVITSMSDMFEDKERAPIDEPTIIEPGAFAEELTNSNRFGLVYELKSDDTVLGKIGIIGELPEVTSDDASTPDEAALKDWREKLVRAVTCAPISLRAIIAEKIASIDALATLKPGDTISFYGATIDEVGFQSAYCDEAHPIVMASLGAKDEMRALQLFGQ